MENSVWLVWHCIYATYYSAGFWPNINPLWPEYNFLPKIIKPYFILNTKLNIIRCLFVVCFKGGMITRAFLGFPLCLMDVSVFAEIPKVVNSLCTITVVREPGQDFKMYLASLHTRICFGSVWGRHIAQVYTYVADSICICEEGGPKDTVSNRRKKTSKQ